MRYREEGREKKITAPQSADQRPLTTQHGAAAGEGGGIVWSSGPPDDEGGRAATESGASWYVFVGVLIVP